MNDQVQQLLETLNTIVEFLTKNGPIFFRNGMLLFSLSVVHFAMYVAQFDLHLAVLLDAGTVARFFLGGFFLYSIVFSVVLLFFHLTFGRELNPFAFAGSANFNSNRLVLIGFAIKNSARLFTHAFSMAIFLVIYVGWTNIPDMAGLIIFYLLLYGFAHLVRRIFSNHASTRDNALPLDVEEGRGGVLPGVFLAICLVTSAMVTGELRAGFVKENYKFDLSSANQPMDATYSVFLTNRAGSFLWSEENNQAIYVPWENSAIFVSNSSQRQVFGLKSTLLSGSD